MAKGLMALLAASPKGDAKTMAAEDLIEAVNAGDASGVATAFQRMYDACASGHEESDEYALDEDESESGLTG